MISGKCKLILASLALLTAWTCHADSLTPESLIGSLARPAPANTLFKEVRFDPVLSEPVVLSGELAWLGGDHLKRIVVSPWSESTDVDRGEVTLSRQGHGTRHFSLTRAPELEGVLGSFQSLLSGNSKQLLKFFSAEVEGDRDGWTLQLVPREAALREKVARIDVFGADQAPRCMRIVNADAGSSMTLFGVLARQPLPAAVSEESLQGVCQAPADGAAR